LHLYKNTKTKNKNYFQHPFNPKIPEKGAVFEFQKTDSGPREKGCGVLGLER
jgi:hypothetical protein